MPKKTITFKHPKPVLDTNDKGINIVWWIIKTVFWVFAVVIASVIGGILMMLN